MKNSNCLFCKIIAGEIPSHKIYEDEDFFAFLDINPINIGHTLLIPKEHYDNIFTMPEGLYEKIWSKAKELAPAIQKAADSKRVGIIIEGFAVPHVHIHLVPINVGNELDPHNQKPAKPEELAAMAEKIKRALSSRP